MLIDEVCETNVEQLRGELRDERKSRMQRENSYMQLVAELEEIRMKKESVEKVCNLHHNKSAGLELLKVFIRLSIEMLDVTETLTYFSFEQSNNQSINQSFVRSFVPS
jgi:hypothetical protein